MTDIVTRLRKVVGDLPPQHHVPLAKEAADEIDRLRAALDTADYYIGRLERYVARKTVTDMTEAEVAYKSARRVLEQKTE